MRRHGRGARLPQFGIPVLYLTVIAGLFLAGCRAPYFIVPGAEGTGLPAEPPPAPAMLIACEENARSLLIPKEGKVRWNGPLKVKVIPTPDAKKKADPDCQEGGGYCSLPVEAQTTLELSVGVLPKAGSATGFLCLCRGEGCEVNCAKKGARLDYKVTCSETRFIRRGTSPTEAGLPLQPLPAHLPLTLSCKDTGGDLDCGPPIILLEDSTVDVYGALRLSGPRFLKKGDALKFLHGEGKGTDAFVCLHETCSNPLYFLPLKVTFEPEPASESAKPPAGAPGG